MPHTGDEKRGYWGDTPHTPDLLRRPDQALVLTVYVVCDIISIKREAARAPILNRTVCSAAAGGTPKAALPQVLSADDLLEQVIGL